MGIGGYPTLFILFMGAGGIKCFQHHWTSGPSGCQSMFMQPTKTHEGKQPSGGGSPFILYISSYTGMVSFMFKNPHKRIHINSISKLKIHSSWQFPGKEEILVCGRNENTCTSKNYLPAKLPMSESSEACLRSKSIEFRIPSLLIRTRILPANRQWRQKTRTVLVPVKAE